MENTIRALVPATTREGRHPDEQDFRCSSCGESIAQGEGRYRFTTRVYHVLCWEARGDDLAAEETIDFRGRLSL